MAAVDPEPASGKIEVYLRNNRGWFRPVNLVVYEPQRESAYLESKLMLPFQRLSLEVPPGTKVYIVSGAEASAVREGKSLLGRPPSLTVRESDAGEEYDIFR